MRRITLDRDMIDRLHNLDEPLEFCDATGWLLGVFTPDASEPAAKAPEVQPYGLPAEETVLGEEISIFGYEEDLE